MRYRLRNANSEHPGIVEPDCCGRISPMLRSGSRSCRFGELQLRSGIASQGCLDDLANQLGVRTARLARGEGELRLDDQPGIGVGLEHVELSVGSEAQVGTPGSG